MPRSTILLKSYSSPSSTLANIPILRVIGDNKGPRLSIVAATNGTQYTGTQACLELYKCIDASTLRGELNLIPCANPAGFDNRERYRVPLNDDFEGEPNLNRIFPGDFQKSTPRKLAKSLFDFLVESSDFLVDIHGGDIFEEIIPCALYTLVASRNAKSKLAETDGESIKLAHSTGMNWIIEGLCDYTKRGRLNVEATFKGIPSIGIETSSSGLLTASNFNDCYDAIHNIMSEINMLEHRERAEQVKSQFVITELKPVRAHFGGLLRTTKHAGDLIKEDDNLGYLLDLNGEVKETFDVPKKLEGVLVEQRTNPVIYSGDIVFEIGTYR